MLVVGLGVCPQVYVHLMGMFRSICALQLMRVKLDKGKNMKHWQFCWELFEQPKDGISLDHAQTIADVKSFSTDT